MGIYSSAYLIWGIPVVAYNEDQWDDQRDEYAATPFWDANKYDGEGDWREFDGDLVIVTYGHYDDPNNSRAILSSSRVPTFSGDCWEPTEISLDMLTVSDKVYSKATDQARAERLGVDFYAQAKWNLVASVG